MMVITQIFELLNLFKVMINKTVSFFAFILLSLEIIAIPHVNIDKAFNAYCLATLINTRCYCNKEKLD